MKTIRIDGVIGSNEGEVSSAQIKSQLPQTNEPIEVQIHSEGGSVFEGFAIYDALKAYAGPKKCVISSSAFSIASYISMAFDDVEITPNGYMMLHSPYAEFEGNDEQFAKQSVLLSQLKANMVSAYSQKTGKTPDEIKAILSAETYYNAEQAVAAGLVNRITPTPVMGRVFAQLNSMPHGIVKALFGAGPSGDNRVPTKGKTMSETLKPVAATVQQIKQAFPKAKAEFIVRCMEQQMPMEQVAVTAVQETMSENDTLMARVAAMETELAAMKAKAMEVEVMPEEEPVVAKATGGVKPVAKAKAATVSARTQWDTQVYAKTSIGIPRAKAVLMVNKENPGLREQMLAEVNG
jgi:ATP-dependent protease ClpP protease subunit